MRTPAKRRIINDILTISPIDPVVFSTAAILLPAVGLAACYLPGRRATRIDAMEALRYE